MRTTRYIEQLSFYVDKILLEKEKTRISEIKCTHSKISAPCLYLQIAKTISFSQRAREKKRGKKVVSISVYEITVKQNCFYINCDESSENQFYFQINYF